MWINCSARMSCYCLLAILGSLAGCQKAPAPAVPARIAPSTTTFTASGWTYHLRRIPTDDSASSDDVPKDWRALFHEMSRDPETLALLTRLHAGLKVEFVALTAEEAGQNEVLGAPPPDGVAVVMRVADLKQTTEEHNSVSAAVRVIAYGHAVRVQLPPVSDPVELIKKTQNAPLPGAPLSLAIEDFILRHAPGWIVRSGPVNTDEKLPESAEEQRRDLDRRIQEYADQTRTFYGIDDRKAD